MGNWTDRFDPETVDEIKRCEVGEGALREAGEGQIP